MTDLIIRPAQLDDAAAIVRIYNAGIRERIATYETTERSGYKDRDKTVRKGTGNGGIKGSGNPSPANVLIGTLMNASEPHGRTLRLNTLWRKIEGCRRT